MISRFHPDSDPENVTVLSFTDDGWSSTDRWYSFCNSGWGATLNNRLLTYCESGNAFEAALARERSKDPIVEG